MNPTLLILIPVYALADRFAGGGFPALDAKLPGRAAFWAALGAAGVGWAVGGIAAALAALAWLIYRTPGWNMFGGGLAPRKSVEAYAGTLARHLIALPLLLAVGMWTGLALSGVVLAVTAYAIVATLLAAWLGNEVTKAVHGGAPIGEQNTFVELARGAAFGAVIVGGLAWVR